jgi:hypothetical protein
MSEWDRLLYMHPWFAAIFQLVWDVAAWALNHWFELLVLYFLGSIQYVLYSRIRQSAQLYDEVHTLKNELERIKYGIAEIHDAIDPIAKDLRIDMELRHGTMKPWEARILRGLDKP